jgi:hypothetical protein
MSMLLGTMGALLIADAAGALQGDRGPNAPGNDLPGLVRDADVIADATVISLFPAAPLAGARGGQPPRTDALLKVNRLLKGKAADQIVVSQIGPAGAGNLTNNGGPMLQPGENIIIFLARILNPGRLAIVPDRGIARFDSIPGDEGIIRIVQSKARLHPNLAGGFGRLTPRAAAWQKHEGLDVKQLVAEIEVHAKVAGATYSERQEQFRQQQAQGPAPARGGATLPAASAPALTVSGTVVMEGAAARPSFRLQLTGLGVSRSVLISDASFSLSVPPGQPQQISIQDLPAGYVVRSVTDGGAGNLLWTPLIANAGGASPRIVVTLGVESAGR